MLDDATFGFSKPDALELVQLIGNADGEHNEWHPLGSDGVGMFLYTLTSSTHGTIRDMADAVEVTTAVAVIDTLGMFADQVTGDRGICTIDGGIYYRVQAPCKT